MRDAKKFGGRPRGRAPGEGDRVHLGFRVTPELKQRVEAAAARSGRSQSQEAELRLERSFEKQALLEEALRLRFGPDLTAVLMLLGLVMKSSTTWSSIVAQKKWIDDPWAFDRVAKSAINTIERLRPEGEPRPPSAGEETLVRRMADPAVILTGIVDPNADGDELVRVRNMLGAGLMARIGSPQP